MQIRWTADASDQLIRIFTHIQESNPAAARNVTRTLMDRIARLETFPKLGRPGEVGGTRELVSPPYVVVYRIADEVIEILHIWHGAQDWR